MAGTAASGGAGPGRSRGPQMPNCSCTWWQPSWTQGSGAPTPPGTVHLDPQVNWLAKIEPSVGTELLVGTAVCFWCARLCGAHECCASFLTASSVAGFLCSPSRQLRQPLVCQILFLPSRLWIPQKQHWRLQRKSLNTLRRNTLCPLLGMRKSCLPRHGSMVKRFGT